MVLTSPHNLKRHEKVVHDKIKHQCPLCPRKYVQKAGLTRHWVDKHKGLKDVLQERVAKGEKVVYYDVLEPQEAPTAMRE
jgi:hypothetical protein